MSRPRKRLPVWMFRVKWRRQNPGRQPALSGDDAGRDRATSRFKAPADPLGKIGCDPGMFRGTPMPAQRRDVVRRELLRITLPVLTAADKACGRYAHEREGFPIIWRSTDGYSAALMRAGRPDALSRTKRPLSRRWLRPPS